MSAARLRTKTTNNTRMETSIKDNKEAFSALCGKQPYYLMLENWLALQNWGSLKVTSEASGQGFAVGVSPKSM